MANELPMWMKEMPIENPDKKKDKIVYDPETAHQVEGIKKKTETIAADTNLNKDGAFVDQLDQY